MNASRHCLAALATTIAAAGGLAAAASASTPARASAEDPTADTGTTAPSETTTTATTPTTTSTATTTTSTTTTAPTAAVVTTTTTAPVTTTTTTTTTTIAAAPTTTTTAAPPPATTTAAPPPATTTTTTTSSKAPPRCTVSKSTRLKKRRYICRARRRKHHASHRRQSAAGSAKSPSTTSSQPTTSTTTSSRTTAANTSSRSTDTTTAAASTASSSLSASSDGLQTAQDIALSRVSALLASGDRPPSVLIPSYKAAARRYDIPWNVLAAINLIETDYSHNLNVSSAGAEGWMQFMPTTWERYGLSVGVADPDNAKDAIFAAARYLKANGGVQHLRRAIFAYNHATWYVDEVMWMSEQIAGEGRLSHSAHLKLTAMLSTAGMLNGLPYVYGGGHGGWTSVDGYDCSGFVSAVLHAAGYLTEPVTTQTLPSQPKIASGPGKWVTIFDRTDASSVSEDHVIIEINGSGGRAAGSSTSGAEANVHRIRDISASIWRHSTLSSIRPTSDHRRRTRRVGFKRRSSRIQIRFSVRRSSSVCRRFQYPRDAAPSPTP